jgi:histidyl-tRNA synthetase
VKAQMRESNRQAALYTLILGDNEIAGGSIAVKEMATGTQQTVPLEAAIAMLRERQQQ